MPNYRRLFIENSCVFITIVTYDRKPFLLDNIGLLRESFREVRQKYSFDILACVILPEHIHLILKPESIKSYPKIIRALKYNFSKKINEGTMAIVPYFEDSRRAGLLSRQNRIWQRRYYEHTIRDEDDLNKHLDYIHYNPVKHGIVPNVKDWGFSSFQKFVKMGNYEFDWGSSQDVEKILSLSYE